MSVLFLLGQVRSLTNDVISKPCYLHTVTKCRNFATLPRKCNLSKEDKIFRKYQALGTNILYILDFSYRLSDVRGQVSHVTSPIISLDIENIYIGEILKLFILQKK